MNKKIAVIWLSLTMIFTSFVILVEIAPKVKASTIWFVDDVPGSGGPGNPPEDFTSIQDAINVAQPGDTVFVYNGTYYENIVVNRTINLIGENKKNTTINGGGIRSVVYVNVSWVNVTGFTVNGSEPSCFYGGIELNDVQNCSIFNNNISSNKGDGIYFILSSNNHITNNIVSSNNFGIFLRSSPNNEITNNNVSSSIIDGIHLSKSSDYNIITSNNLSNNDCGISLMDSNCSIITSNNAWNNYNGISLIRSRNNTITNNSFSYNNNGICIYHSSNNTIVNNNVSSNSHGIGIGLDHSNNNTITNNNAFSNNWHGIHFLSSSRNKLSGNTMINNGIWIGGDGLEHWDTHTIDTTNTVNGKPVYYWKNKTGGGIPIGAGEVILANCTDVRVENQYISDGSVGILVGFSSKNSIVNNTAISNNWDGISLSHSSNNEIANNNASLNNRHGIYISYSINNTIANNTAFSNTFGVGIHLHYSSSSNIVNNYLSDNWYGINLASSNSNTLNDNIASNNDNGITISLSRNNLVYHNNIINNTIQAIHSRWNNYWNNSYPSGGNFWSDYIGFDNFKGPNQDIPGSDGIGDTNYSIEKDSVDNYPLMKPIGNYIFLYEGWNLISIPFILSNTNLGVIFNSIKGLYDAAQWYNISDTSDHWKHNSTKKPSHLNDLNRIDHTMGFWIHITEPGGILFQYPGTKPMANQTINIHPGWNLIGYPSITSYNRTEGLNNLIFGLDVDAIWTYNAATQKWMELGPSNNFELGRGYWMHSKVTKTWIVPL